MINKSKTDNNKIIKRLESLLPKLEVEVEERLEDMLGRKIKKSKNNIRTDQEIFFEEDQTTILYVKPQIPNIIYVQDFDYLKTLDDNEIKPLLTHEITHNIVKNNNSFYKSRTIPIETYCVVEGFAEYITYKLFGKPSLSDLYDEVKDHLEIIEENIKIGSEIINKNKKRPKPIRDLMDIIGLTNNSAIKKHFKEIDLSYNYKREFEYTNGLALFITIEKHFSENRCANIAFNPKTEIITNKHKKVIPKITYEEFDKPELYVLNRLRK